MIKIGITGSLASGKSTVAKIISSNKYPLFDADKAENLKQILSNQILLKNLVLKIKKILKKK